MQQSEATNMYEWIFDFKKIKPLNDLLFESDFVEDDKFELLASAAQSSSSILGIANTVSFD